MNNEDWEFLYSLAGTTFQKGKFLQGLTKDDFKQMCALAAMENIQHLQDSETKRTRVSNIVYFMKRKYVASKYNRKQGPDKAWKRVEHEIRLDEDAIDESYLADWGTVNQIEAILHSNEIRKQLNKLLKPLEIEIIDSILQGMNYTDIAKKYSRTKDAISKRVQVINKKLEGLVV